jgi:hypothetical protein
MWGRKRMTSLRPDSSMEEKYEVFSCPILRNVTAVRVRIVTQSCVIGLQVNLHASSPRRASGQLVVKLSGCPKTVKELKWWFKMAVMSWFLPGGTEESHEKASVRVTGTRAGFEPGACRIQNDRVPHAVLLMWLLTEKPYWQLHFDCWVRSVDRLWSTGPSSVQGP